MNISATIGSMSKLLLGLYSVYKDSFVILFLLDVAELLIAKECNAIS